jgi:hypothetical protein
MTDIAIRVENLSKRYRIGARQKRANTLRDTLRNLGTSPFDYLRRTLRGPTEEEIIWVLKDISFEACPEPAEGSSVARWWASLRQPFDGAQDNAQGKHWPQRGGEEHTARWDA